MNPECSVWSKTNERPVASTYWSASPPGSEWYLQGGTADDRRMRGERCAEGTLQICFCGTKRNEWVNAALPAFYL